MNIRVIASKKDPAGVNIASFLPYCELIEEELLYSTFTSGDLIIFASKHSSKNPRPSYSCHVTGNFGPAMLGGKPETLSMAPALIVDKMLELLESDREVFQEVTHHGPTLDIPSIFVEIGSTKKEWEDPKCGKFIAEKIDELKTLLEKRLPKKPVAIGIGGLHHMPSFKKTPYAIGHACAKYNLEYFTEEMLDEAIKKTVEPVDLVLLDWKGLGKHKHRVVNIIEKKGIKWKKTTSSLLL